MKKQNFKFVLSQNEQDKSRYIKDSIISIAKSGTISLDICKNMCPLITIYKMTNLNYLLIKPFVKVKFVNIINIIDEIERNNNLPILIFLYKKIKPNKPVKTEINKQKINKRINGRKLSELETKEIPQILKVFNI